MGVKSWMMVIENEYILRDSWSCCCHDKNIGVEGGSRRPSGYIFELRSREFCVDMKRLGNQKEMSPLPVFQSHKEKQSRKPFEVHIFPGVLNDSFVCFFFFFNASISLCT